MVGDRNSSYGNPKDDFVGTGLMWTGLLQDLLKPGVVIPPERVSLMMAALKLRREANKHKRDNIVDAHGYLLCHEWIIDGTPPTK